MLVDLTLGGPQAVTPTKSDALVSIERLIGSAFDDALTAGAGSNRLEGGAGRDRLDGGTGADTLLGGLGDDAYIIDDLGDVADEAGGDGADIVRTSVDYTLAAGIERVIVTSAGGLTLTGNGDANRLDGGAGGDTLLGLGGDDVLAGGGGIDTPDGGRGVDVLNGGSEADSLTGGADADRLDGGTGADTMTGGAGDDVYYVDDAADSTDETGGDGYDIVRTSVDYAVAAGIERVIVAGPDGRTVTGSGAAERLDGGAGADALRGLGSDDVLVGGGGGDMLEAGLQRGRADAVLGPRRRRRRRGGTPDHLRNTHHPGRRRLPADLKARACGPSATPCSPTIPSLETPMPYVTGFLTPVKTEDRQRYIDSAAFTWPIFQELGALTQVETWGDNVPDGEHTSFPLAVKLQPGEVVVFSWVTWPDRATADAAFAKMMDDPRMQNMDMPFDGQRMMWGGFETIFEG